MCQTLTPNDLFAQSRQDPRPVSAQLTSVELMIALYFPEKVTLVLLQK